MRHALTILALCSGALVACGQDEFGEGTRRPPTVIVPRPEPVSITVTEVFFGDVATAAFVELLNTGPDPIALGDFSLVTNLEGKVALGGDIAAGERLVFNGVEALLSATSGEVAVRDASGTVHAYAAWGGDPGGRSSTLYADAFSSGLTLPHPPQLTAPYPVDPSLALVFEEPRGCAPPSSGAPPGAVVPCPEGTGALRLTEIFVGESLSWVEVRNDSSETLPLLGARLCLAPSCAPVLQATGPLAPGEHGVILQGVDLSEVSALPPEAVGLSAGGTTTLECGNAIVCASAPLRPLSGNEEIAASRPGDRGLQAEALLDYARLGAASTMELEADAVAAGFWTAGAIEAAPGAGESVQLDPAAVTPGPDAWLAAPVTPGAPYVP